MLPSKAGPVDAKLRQCHNSHLQNKYSIQFHKSQEKICLFFKIFFSCTLSEVRATENTEKLLKINNIF